MSESYYKTNINGPLKQISRKEACLIFASIHYTPCTLSMCYKVVLFWAWSLFCIFRARGRRCQAFIRVFSTFRGSTPAPFTPPWSDTDDMARPTRVSESVFYSSVTEALGKHRCAGNLKPKSWNRRCENQTLDPEIHCASLGNLKPEIHCCANLKTKGASLLGLLTVIWAACVALCWPRQRGRLEQVEQQRLRWR